MRKKIQILPKFDKHFYYTHSVQSAEHDAELLWKMYRRAYPKQKRRKIVLQEDFCGTAALCYEWGLLGPEFEAVGIDLDQTALTWGESAYANSLPAQQGRVVTICGDVLSEHHFRPHVLCALNFSYFFIDERRKMLNYFTQVKSTLDKEGLFILDCFGGPAYLKPHSDKRYNSEQKFHYWWNVDAFDALSHKMRCHIDYQRRGEGIRKNVFTYEWRLWSVPEITDLLKESGFSNIEFWSEGLDRNGDGDGEFKPVIKEEGCEAWVCYIVAKP